MSDPANDCLTGRTVAVVSHEPRVGVGYDLV